MHDPMLYNLYQKVLYVCYVIFVVQKSFQQGIQNEH